MQLAVSPDYGMPKEINCQSPEKNYQPLTRQRLISNMKLLL